MPVAVLMLIGGVGLLVGGSQILVDGAVNIATALGVSGLVIGLTVVAIGTSLPELAASVVAVRKGQTELAVGNAVGSCLANIGLVLGLPALLAPGGLDVPGAAVALDIPLMIATALVLLPVAFTRALIVRWEGLVFVGLYAAYTGYVVLAASDHDAAAGFSTVMLIFVLPLVAGLPLLSAVYEAGVRHGRGQSRIPAED
jgi:cation:H+ antiporter